MAFFDLSLQAYVEVLKVITQFPLPLAKKYSETSFIQTLNYPNTLLGPLHKMHTSISNINYLNF